jgi:transcriptional regulator NrdR family protein
MKCPYCGMTGNQVFKTEKYDDVIVRIRVCKHCEKSFRTDEEAHKKQQTM